MVGWDNFGGRFCSHAGKPVTLALSVLILARLSQTRKIVQKETRGSESRIVTLTLESAGVSTGKRVAYTGSDIPLGIDVRNEGQLFSRRGFIPVDVESLRIRSMTQFFKVVDGDFMVSWIIGTRVVALEVHRHGGIQ